MIQLYICDDEYIFCEKYRKMAEQILGMIRRIVDKYDGLCQFYEEENMFCAVAMIPAVPPEA